MDRVRAADIFNSNNQMDCSSKRGRGNDTNDTATTTSKKEAVTTAEEAAEEVVGHRKESVEGFLVVEEAAAAAATAAEVEELRWSGVDEEMPWATCWFPFWEVEAKGDAYDALYGDVWDYDIWGFKGGHN